MIKKFNPAVFILVQFLFLRTVDCQVPVNMTGYLSDKFSGYVKSVPREELYIHTDREEYISGEDLWFNVYLIDRQSFKPSTESKIAYFELLNPDNHPVVQKRIRLDDGFGPGQIVLPDTLRTGKYTIRAYTNWMKNFLPYDCFIKEINIYNSFSNKTIRGGLNTFNTGYEKNGNLISPDEGIKLSVNNQNSDFLEIYVTADTRFRNDNKNLIYLFIQTHGLINYVSFEKLSDEKTKLSVPKNLLLAGINQITVFNSAGKPVAEKLMFTPEKEEPLVTLHVADSFSVRKKISLDLEAGKVMNASVNPANVSISVAPLSSNAGWDDIHNYLIFGTEYGSAPFRLLRNKNIKDIAPEVMDSLLQTLKSNWIDWSKILNEGLPAFQYRIENENHYLSGKIMGGNEKDNFIILSHPGKVADFQYANSDSKGKFNFGINIDEKVNDLMIQSDEVKKGQSIIIESSFWDQYPRIATASDSTDNPIPNYISKWSANNQVNKIYGGDYASAPLIREWPSSPLKRFYGKPDKEIVLKDYIALPVMQEVFYELLAGVSLKPRKSGWELTMSDPVTNKPYSTAPGLFVDGVIVKDASVAGSLDPELVEKIDVVKDKYYVGDYLFYGVVNIITKAGDFSNVSLPENAIRLPYRVIDPVSSFSAPDYSSPASSKSRIPDFRNTLYWNPAVSVKEGSSRIEFWASDFVSDYEINIQGITKEGQPFAVKKLIKVKR